MRGSPCRACLPRLPPTLSSHERGGVPLHPPPSFSCGVGEGNTNSIHKARYLVETLLGGPNHSSDTDMELAAATVLLARLSLDGVELDQAHRAQMRAPVIKALEALLLS